jgi:CheY-like chemotaxis protein
MSENLNCLTARLREQLRHLQQVAAPQQTPDAAPISLPRAIVATRLLGFRTGQGPPAQLSPWFGALLDVLQWLQEHRAADPAACEHALHAIASFEETLLQQLDAGGDLAPLIDVSQIGALQAELLQALVGAEAHRQRHFLQAADDLIRALEGLPQAEAAAAAQDPDWHSRWQRICTLGEALLPAGAEAPGSPLLAAEPREESLPPDRFPANSPPVLLLVADSIRTGTILQKLQKIGPGVVLCSTASEAAQRLQEGERFCAVLCDNVEPSRHLQNLSLMLGSRPDLRRAPLLLVTAGKGEGLARRARQHGAVGIWGPPYSAADLRSLINRSHSRPL